MLTKLTRKLIKAHEAEAEAKCAKFFNLGWARTDTGIASKTNKGSLSLTLPRNP